MGFRNKELEPHRVLSTCYSLIAELAGCLLHSTSEWVVQPLHSLNFDSCCEIKPLSELHSISMVQALLYCADNPLPTDWVSVVTQYFSGIGRLTCLALHIFKINVKLDLQKHVRCAFQLVNPCWSRWKSIDFVIVKLHYPAISFLSFLFF
jgi:hypothetical protein